MGEGYRMVAKFQGVGMQGFQFQRVEMWALQLAVKIPPPMARVATDDCNWGSSCRVVGTPLHKTLPQYNILGAHAIKEQV